MERNLALYPWYQALRGLYFWMPIFFLYFSSRLAPGEVLAIEALYYLAVVVLEVPSGYASDRLGRRLTLIVSTSSWTAGCLALATSSTFVGLALGQVLLAVSMAFNSGTDNALLYESLRRLGREGELARREARAQGLAFIAAAGSALIGGAIGGLDLRLAYVLSALTGLAAVMVAFAFREPDSDRSQALPAGAQLVAVVRCTRDPVLAWVLVFTVGAIVFDHVPYELYQPYLALIAGDGSAGGYATTPLLSGMLLALVGFCGAGASVAAPRLLAMLGPGAVLVLAFACQAGVITVMGAWLAPWVLLVVMARAVPAALSRPVTLALVHPRIPDAVRATYLSAQSLAGRLAFSGALAAGGAALGDLEALGWPALSGLLRGYAIAAWLMVPVLLVGAMRIRRARADDAARGGRG